MAAIIRDLLDGEDLEGAARRSVTLQSNKPDSGETASALGAALTAHQSKSSGHFENVRQLDEGWVGEAALAVGLYAALAGGSSFGEVLAIATNHDGDSDA